MYRMLALMVIPTSALAVTPPPAPPEPTPPPESEEQIKAEEPPSMQPYQEMGFRYRHMFVPRSFVDNWYFDADTPDWPYVEARPAIVANAYGLEYGVRNRGSNGIFYVEFIDSAMKAGYWDDIEEPPNHLDGDWLSPTAGLGMVAFGADYAYEAHAIRVEQTGGAFGWSWLFGGGLGLGVVTGQLNKWSPDAAGNPGYKSYLDGLPPDGKQNLPGAFPMVDVNVATRLNFGNRACLRIEGGLHTFLYFGTAVSVML
jgi:hypothetical protein